MGGKIIDQVLPYITKRPGEIVYATEIAADLGLDRRSVATAVSNARKNSPTLDAEIEVITAATAWRYRPPAVDTRSITNGQVTATRRTSTATTPMTPTTSDRRYFGEIHTTRDGIVIVKDENDKLYRLEEL